MCLHNEHIGVAHVCNREASGMRSFGSCAGSLVLIGRSGITVGTVAVLLFFDDEPACFDESASALSLLASFRLFLLSSFVAPVPVTFAAPVPVPFAPVPVPLLLIPRSFSSSSLLSSASIEALVFLSSSSIAAAFFSSSVTSTTSSVA